MVLDKPVRDLLELHFGRILELDLAVNDEH